MKDKLILILLGIILISATAVTTNVIVTKPKPPIDAKVVSYYDLNELEATKQLMYYTSQGYIIKAATQNSYRITVFLEKY